MFLEFEKWHGCRNDFIVIWISRAEKDLIVPSLQRQAPALCAKNGSGIGADGILVMISPQRDDGRAEELAVINMDGSLARNCGNGLRCAGASMVNRLRSRGAGADEWQWMELPIEGQPFSLSVLEDGAVEKHLKIGFDNVLIGSAVPWAREVGRELEAIMRGHGLGAALPSGGMLHFAEIGNPHAVWFTEDLDREVFMAAGRAAQELRAIDGINLHMAQRINPAKNMAAAAQRVLGEAPEGYFQVLSWERGVGETAACGSGATAVAAAAMEDGEAGYGSWQALYPPGGGLYVRREDARSTAELAGPAHFVFQGRIEI